MFQYSEYRLSSLKELRITLDDIEPLIQDLDNKIFTSQIIGFSEQKRPIYRIKFGKGNTTILLWTQMHGNESTATKSLFDVFNIVNSSKFTNVINLILESCTVYCIPMLNPDGSFYYTRENALGNDLNRDAKTLQNKEAQLLWQQVLELQPDFAFNLHDQTAYYNVENTTNIASISLLAPASDENRSLTAARKKAMSVIVGMNEHLQDLIPNQVGRYNDTYCDSCFGDTIQEMNIPTILIECGYFFGDETREKTRLVHTEILIKALENIACSYFPDEQLYFSIPQNEKKYYDYKITNVYFQDKITNLAIRFKTVLTNGIVQKVLDEEETIEIGEECNLLFYRSIDAFGVKFEDLLINI